MKYISHCPLRTGEKCRVKITHPDPNDSEKYELKKCDFEGVHTNCFIYNADQRLSEENGLIE